MPQKVETTTKKFREGVQLNQPVAEISWESTGHLSVRLLCGHGVTPLVARKVKVVIPGEGIVELETDDDGRVSYPDVPFKDYELDLGDGVKVSVPAVATPGRVQERHVPEVFHGVRQVVICDAEGFPLERTRVRFESDAGPIEAVSDDHGVCKLPTPIPPGSCEVTVFAGKTAIGKTSIDLSTDAEEIERLCLELE